MLTTNQLMSRADILARQVGGAGGQENQLAFVLVHLKRHRNIEATLLLLKELKSSPFAYRSRSTPGQFRALEEYVRPALKGISTWEEAAGIIGWARRLLAS